MNRGFTLLETMITIGILGMIFLVGLQANTIFQNVLAGRGARQVESVLGLASMRARSGVQGTDWGVYFAYDDVTRKAVQAVIFSGSSYAARDASRDIVFPLGRDLTFPTVAFSGIAPSSLSDHEITFTFLSGATSQYGSMTIASYASSTQIDVSPTGIAVLN